jgi:hypothetical protein
MRLSRKKKSESECESEEKITRVRAGASTLVLPSEAIAKEGSLSAHLR